jgi:AraC-like DNA-binding protein
MSLNIPHPLAMTDAPSNLGVLSAAASGLDRFIGLQGGDAERVFGVAGIDPDLLLHPTLSLSLSNYCKVLEEAASQSGCDNFGLRYGQQFQPRALGLLGYVGLCSDTLEQALRNFALAFPYHQHDTLIRLVDIGECYRFDYQVRHPAILDKRQDAELTMGMALNLVRHVLGPTWAPRAVLFEHGKPEGWREHQAVFDAPILFDQPCNALLIPKRDIVGRLMPERDPVLLMLVQDAIARLGGQQHQQCLVDQARGLVRDALPLGEPGLEQIAAGLGLSGASLQRRLREQNLSYSALIDQVRRELALHYLRRRLPITELAPLLGYSETSAFSRAFRRWFATSPRQWLQAPTA